MKLPFELVYVGNEVSLTDIGHMPESNSLCAQTKHKSHHGSNIYGPVFTVAFVL